MNFKRLCAILMLVLVAVTSFFWVADWAADPVNHAHTIESIDANSTTVLRLAAASTAASAAISLIPDDTATPIAEKLADFSEYFLLILCVLYTEKYMLTLIGALAFRVLIPLACGALIVGFLWKPDLMHRFALKFLLVALAAFIAIPVSIRASDMITATYAQNMEEVIESTENFADSTGKLSQANGDKGVLKSILENMSETVSSLLNKASTLINHFIELLAVMIVTSCVIPSMLLLFFIWMIKTVTGIQISVPMGRAKVRKALAEE